MNLNYKAHREIEQAIAQAGTVAGAVELTGADPELVKAVYRRMDIRNGRPPKQQPMKPPSLPKQPKQRAPRWVKLHKPRRTVTLYAPAGMDTIAALRVGRVTVLAEYAADPGGFQ